MEKTKIGTKKLLAQSILKLVGDAENITFFTHCMTRLRFTLKASDKVDLDELSALNGVLGCQWVGEQLQVIIGPSVSNVYKEICQIGGLTQQEAVKDEIKEDVEKFSKKNFSFKAFFSGILDSFAACLTPILPVLICAGLLKMITAVIGPDMLKLVDSASNLYRLLVIAGDAGFYFLPILIAISGSKRFGCNTMIAVLMAGILLSPGLIEIVNSGEAFTVYGIPMISMTYSSTVMPMILITYTMSLMEKLLKKIIPDVVKSLLVPLLTVLIMLPLSLCLLGPIGLIIGLGLSKVLVMLHTLLGPLGVAIIGCLYVFLVATGMHLPLILVAIESMNTVGCDSIVLVGAFIGAYACMAIGLGTFIKAKDPELKNLSFSCFVAQLFGGVAEPTIFGIIFRYRRTMISGTIGIFCGTLYAAIMHAGIYFFGASNIMGFLSFSGENPSSVVHGAIGCAISFVVTLICMLILGYEKKSEVK